jgi:signal transduction histidine kinase
MLQEIVFTGGSILGFFVFGISILEQGVSVLIRVRDLEGLGVLADDMEAILVRLSLIRGRGARGVGGAGVGGARGVEGLLRIHGDCCGRCKVVVL